MCVIEILCGFQVIANLCVEYGFGSVCFIFTKTACMSSFLKLCFSSIAMSLRFDMVLILFPPLLNLR